MEFTDQYKTKAARIPKGTLPLRVWHDLVGKEFDLVPESQVYKPVHMLVQLTEDGRPTKVAVKPWTNGWYDRVREGIAAMTGARDYKRLELVDDLDEPIVGWSPDRLAAYEDAVRVWYNEERLHLANPPRQVAVAMDPNKEALLANWWDDNRAKLADEVASQLEGTETETQLTKLCEFNGPIENTIRDVLTESIDDQFVSDFAETEAAGSRTPKEVINDLSGSVLTALRVGLRNDKAVVHGCLANYVGEGVLGGTTVKATPNEYTQYRDIADHAFNWPMGHNVIIVVRDGKRKKKRKAKKRDKKDGNGKTVTVHNVTRTTAYKPFAYAHPYRDAPSWWYGRGPYPRYNGHSHYYGQGYAPAHTTVQHHKTVVRVDKNHRHKKNYKGDYNNTVHLYHAFSRRAPVPTVKFMKATVPGFVPVYRVVGKKQERASPVTASYRKQRRPTKEERNTALSSSSINKDFTSPGYWGNVGADIGQPPRLVERNPRSNERAPRLRLDKRENSPIRASSKRQTLTPSKNRKEGLSRLVRRGDVRKTDTYSTKQVGSSVNDRRYGHRHRHRSEINSDEDLVGQEQQERTQPLFGNVKSFEQILAEQRRKKAEAKRRDSGRF